MKSQDPAFFSQKRLGFVPRNAKPDKRNPFVKAYELAIHPSETHLAGTRGPLLDHFDRPECGSASRLARARYPQVSPTTGLRLTLDEARAECTCNHLWSRTLRRSNDIKSPAKSGTWSTGTSGHRPTIAAVLRLT